ncbi:hypothetical protein EGR_06001 [Echinococcus granulosus]|uniref:Uncharacterized protein n=1 Tax=Echinococcus granulosus TaxID=6210 RepID=W6UDM8_ECHGR|nr:hypothetical protein EGR_06001 [Echinococcus granulosus]EUB59138.1 hypothetical protein EGR_06001 [Echinococcus granulosus]
MVLQENFFIYSKFAFTHAKIKTKLSYNKVIKQNANSNVGDEKIRISGNHTLNMLQTINYLGRLTLICSERHRDRCLNANSSPNNSCLTNTYSRRSSKATKILPPHKTVSAEKSKRVYQQFHQRRVKLLNHSSIIKISLGKLKIAHTASSIALPKNGFDEHENQKQNECCHCDSSNNEALTLKVAYICKSCDIITLNLPKCCY